MYIGVWRPSKYSSIVNLDSQSVHVNLKKLTASASLWGPPLSRLLSFDQSSLNQTITSSLPRTEEWCLPSFKLTYCSWVDFSHQGCLPPPSFLPSFVIRKNTLHCYSLRQGNASHTILRGILLKTKQTYLS